MNIQSLKHFLHIANEAEHTYDAKRLYTTLNLRINATVNWHSVT